ncbi:MAG: Uma2 family endonuclease [Myxococcota bacterium]
MEARHLHYDLDEYAEIEAASELRFELVRGQLVAMAGGILAHADLIAEVAATLRAELRETSCRITSSDLRIGHDPSGFRAYPDVVVRCRPPETSPLPPKDTLLNPTMVVEVTSDRTERYDRGQKLAAYQKIQSLEAILIISHRERRIDVYECIVDDWTMRVYSFGETVKLRDG